MRNIDQTDIVHCTKPHLDVVPALLGFNLPSPTSANGV